MPISTALRPPLEEKSVDNNGPLVSIFTFIPFSVTLIVVIIKTWSMVYLKRVVLSVDIPIWAGTIVALVQSLLIQFAVDHGMGRHLEDLLSTTFHTYNKVSLLLADGQYWQSLATCSNAKRHVGNISLVTALESACGSTNNNALECPNAVASSPEDHLNIRVSDFVSLLSTQAACKQLNYN
ncbi:hypothetical protein AO1008_04101 [Aspergillus oryzae 100-8]|uniref:Uncharacterized protein n=1 Tax=Aspergillus oryzae (strain 3.042) TaxID=1160506 RepID=I8TKR6_ASPO3|nr:hypothetical protein Ao3042_09693 [Aspergillus oryzae 3.042]KDE77906.1 hypothetical protein AO1008_04101 [Aspergillus oryzae 100-8]|eukprot:EIT74388.1 hypothetical protein Ao3042_09693 [Aspergillus oryzae 3.042]